MVLYLLLIATWLGVGVGRQVWGDGLGGWRSIPANARALIKDPKAAKRHRVPLVVGSWAWTVARTGWRGARWGHRSVATGARWGWREGHERSREWEERAQLRSEITLATGRVDAGTGSVMEVRRLERRLEELEARQLAHRSARGSAWIHRWHGPGTAVVDGVLQFGSDPADRVGRADCSECSGSGPCAACDRRETLLAEWDARGEQSAVEWYAARRAARQRAAEDMHSARDQTTWAEAHARHAETSNANWGRADSTGSGGTVLQFPVIPPVVPENEGRHPVSTPNGTSGSTSVDSEVTTYPAVLTFLGALANDLSAVGARLEAESAALTSDLSAWGPRVEIASATLVELGLGPETMSDMASVDEAVVNTSAAVLAALSSIDDALSNAYNVVNAALAGIQSRHGGINEVVSGATELAKLDFYRG